MYILYFILTIVGLQSECHLAENNCSNKTVDDGSMTSNIRNKDVCLPNNTFVSRNQDLILKRGKEAVTIKDLYMSCISGNEVKSLEILKPLELTQMEKIVIEFYDFNRGVFFLRSHVTETDVSVEFGVKHLLITFNGLTWNENTFQHYENISQLKIRSCSTMVPEKLFSNLKELKTLVWVHDVRYVFGRHAIDRLPKLENLTIQLTGENYLETKYNFLDFHNMTTLREVHLIKTFNKYVDEGLFKGALNLTFVEIIETYLDKLPNDLFIDQANIIKLVLKNNFLVMLEGQLFQNLQKLKFLDLSNNRIKEIMWGSSLLPSLEVLDTSNNSNLVCIHAHLNSTNFQTIECQNCLTLETDIITEAFVCKSKDVCDFFNDRNGTKCPESCTCQLERTNYSFVIKCENISTESFHEVPKPNIGSITLNIENVLMKSLPNNNSYGYANVERILASGNRLTSLSTVQIPNNIKYLDVTNNNLTNLEKDVIDVIQKLKPDLKLSHNLWYCDCKFVPFFRFIKKSSKQIKDLDQLYCANTKTNKILIELNEVEICAPNTVLIISTIASIVVLFAIMVAIYATYRQTINIWLYEHGWCLFCIVEAELDENMIYDAFISYSSHDLDIVLQFVDNLEKCPNPFRLCIYDRNWPPGVSISDRIVESIDKSRRTIIILSQHYVDSNWGRMEFRMAIKATLEHKRRRLIVVLLDDPENFNNLDREMEAYLKINTYIKWNIPNFWSKLRYAMPHQQPGLRGVRRNNEISMQNIM